MICEKQDKVILEKLSILMWYSTPSGEALCFVEEVFHWSVPVGGKAAPQTYNEKLLQMMVYI